jgi:hypothetical protein
MRFILACPYLAVVEIEAWLRRYTLSKEIAEVALSIWKKIASTRESK